MIDTKEYQTQSEKTCLDGKYFTKQETSVTEVVFDLNHDDWTKIKYRRIRLSQEADPKAHQQQKQLRNWIVDRQNPVSPLPEYTGPDPLFVDAVAAILSQVNYGILEMVNTTPAKLLLNNALREKAMTFFAHFDPVELNIVVGNKIIEEIGKLACTRLESVREIRVRKILRDIQTKHQGISIEEIQSDVRTSFATAMQKRIVTPDWSEEEKTAEPDAEMICLSGLDPDDFPSELIV